MSAPNSIPLADTSDMASLHQVFRDALSATPTYIATVADGDAGRAELVGSYYDNVLRLLHVHHDGEDELLTPRLLDRNPDQADLIREIAGQHHVVVGSISTAGECIAAWRADPSPVNRSAAVDALTTLDTSLTPHLDREELELVPIAAQCINAAEWGELPEHGMRSFDGDKTWLILGLIREQMSDQKNADMDAHMPPPAVEFWTTTGKPLFEQYVGELRA
jgi:hemerythrin-like domain-containing protein